MAYKSSGLSAVSYSNGYTAWHYRSADNASALQSADYFNHAALMFRTGDTIDFLSNDYVGRLMVTGNQPDDRRVYVALAYASPRVTV